jgi:pyrimidine-nucleoside phosphorylase
MILAAKLKKNLESARKLALSRLEDGSAWEVFLQLVIQQGGDPTFIQDPTRLPVSRTIKQWRAKRRGILNRIDCEGIGLLLVDMKGGRRRAADAVDPGTGFIFHKKLGARIAPNDLLVTAYLPEDFSETQAAELEARFQGCLEISSARKPLPKLIAGKPIG